jgi:hypothetical protein
MKSRSSKRNSCVGSHFLNVGTTRFEFCACKELLAYWQIAIFLGFGRKRIMSHPHFMVCANMGCKMLGAKRTPVKASNPERRIRVAQTRRVVQPPRCRWHMVRRILPLPAFNLHVRCVVYASMYALPDTFTSSFPIHTMPFAGAVTSATAKPKVCNRVDDRPDHGPTILTEEAPPFIRMRCQSTSESTGAVLALRSG